MKCEICNKYIRFLQSYVYVVGVHDNRILGKYHIKCFDKERAKEWKKYAETVRGQE